MLNRRGVPARPGHGGAALVLAVGVLLVGIAGCGGGSAPSSSNSVAATSAPGQTTAAASSAGGAATAIVCRHLKDLKSLDYAFAANFSILQSLDASSKALTLQHLQAFLAEAPPDLQQAVTDLIAFWTALGQNPTSVTDSDPRLDSATSTLTSWLAKNCA
jgi:hypothetical protein